MMSSSNGIKSQYAYGITKLSLRFCSMRPRYTLSMVFCDSWNSVYAPCKKQDKHCEQSVSKGFKKGAPMSTARNIESRRKLRTKTSDHQNNGAILPSEQSHGPRSSIHYSHSPNDASTKRRLSYPAIPKPSQNTDSCGAGNAYAWMTHQFV